MQDDIISFVFQYDNFLKNNSCHDNMKIKMFIILYFKNVTFLKLNITIKGPHFELVLHRGDINGLDSKFVALASSIT